jgi:DHA2 family multidrug resistance protein
VTSQRDDLPYSAAGPHSPWLIAVVVSIATFMEVLDATIANVSLRHIAGSLGAGQDESTYIITSYLVSNAIVVPISGWLAAVIGRKRFYMICVALFTAASVLCATATSLAQILVWRVVQGVGGGGLAPVEQSIFADSFPVRQRPQAFALYGFTVVLAPAIGPVLGGWLTDAFSWHWVFLINLPVGVLSLVLVWLFVYDSPQTKKDRAERLRAGLKVDYIGFLLVVLGFGSLQIVLDRFERAGGWGTPFVNILGSICVAALVVLVVWELYHPQPVMNLRLLRRPSFAICNIVMFTIGFELLSTTQLLPQMAQELLGYTSKTAGLTLGVAGLATLFLMPAAGILTGRIIQARTLTFVALCGLGVAMLSASHLDLDTGFWDLSHARMLQAIWLPFLFIPVTSLSTIGVPPSQSGDASALINLMRNLGGSVGISYTTTLLAYREQFHHARLAEHITPYNGYGFGTSLSHIAAQIQTQAAMLSYLDLFTALAWCALAVAPLALFLPTVPKGAASMGH